MTALMLQGTGSDVGKSLLVAALCRALTRRGLRVAPFKPQNMSNNAAVTADGGEIGRAQALQARACNLPPGRDMNPVLLKPEADNGSQVIVCGSWRATVRARDYASMKAGLLPEVLQAFDRLKAASDIVIVEGAGSASEINLRKADIANMGFASAARIPVVLVGDIDRGGIFAQLVGTKAVISSADADLVKGFIVNKFRGDPAIFADGYRMLEGLTGWRACGVMPHQAAASRLPAEDSQALDNAVVSGPVSKQDGKLVVVVPRLPRIANTDDLDPLAAEPGVDLRLWAPGRPLPRDADVILLPGSKATLADLAALRAEGWDIDILSHQRQGGHVIGICGGYQMLGRSIADPDGVEGPPAGPVPALGLLDVTTVMTPAKLVTQQTGWHSASGLPVQGYEIHCGRTDGPDCQRPLLRLADGRADGAISGDGRVSGSYLHGLFAADAFRGHLLAGLGVCSQVADWDRSVDLVLDQMADAAEAHLDIDAMLAMARAGVAP